MKLRMAALAIAGAVLGGCADSPRTEPMAGPSFSTRGASGPVVMTRNLYLGANLDPLLAAASPELIPLLAADVWAMVQATDFPARAGALADEVARTNPHLIGLQEAVLYRIQSPGDSPFPWSSPATEVAYDFVEILLDSLTARGLAYYVAALVENTDVELPVFTGAAPIPIDDVRFTDRDVILARSDVATFNPMGDVFNTRIQFAIGGAGGPALEQLRGWTSVDATVHGRTFRFVNTHLEVQSPGGGLIQVLQGNELIALMNASPLPIVAVGDFNSAADGSQTPTYANLVAAGYRDIWNRHGAPGYTCCHAEDLSNHHPELDQRLDIIFLRGFDTSNFVAGGAPRLLGDRPGDRTRDGLWPSDHAGVVAMLRLPPR